MGHGHLHEKAPPIAPRTKRLLAWAVAPFVAATIVGVVVIWPTGPRATLDPQIGIPSELVDAEVVEISPTPCPGAEFGEEGNCKEAKMVLTSGEEEGRSVSLTITDDPSSPLLTEGDEIVLGRTEGAPPHLEYFFADYQRDLPMVILAGIFALVVVALGRLRGLAALIGFVLSLAIIIFFVLPSILEGNNPLLVAIVGGSAVMLVALYMAHGPNVRTTTAVLGTLMSLIITGVLALIFVEATQLTGFTSEEAIFLQVSAGQVSVKGLLLGAIIIGSLGVLDDVTVTQASAVWEIHLANPSYGFKELYSSAIRIGRDHIASTVNTLVLAYAGASLPLLVLFNISGVSMGNVITGEIVAEEVVRTLVGSIGLVASVPITTSLAALVVSRDRPHSTE